MEEESKIIFNEIGLEFMDIKELDGCIIIRL